MAASSSTGSLNCCKTTDQSEYFHVLAFTSNSTITKQSQNCSVVLLERLESPKNMHENTLTIEPQVDDLLMPMPTFTRLTRARKQIKLESTVPVLNDAKDLEEVQQEKSSQADKIISEATSTSPAARVTAEKCCICLKSGWDKVNPLYGEWISKHGLKLHYLCLLSASDIPQTGLQLN